MADILLGLQYLQQQKNTKKKNERNHNKLKFFEQVHRKIVDDISESFMRLLHWI